MVNEALLSLLVCPLGKAPLRREGDAFDLHALRSALFDRRRDSEHADRRGRATAGVQIARRSSLRQVRRSKARLTVLQVESSTVLSVLEDDDVAGFHLTPFPQLDLAVDPDRAGGDHRFGLAPALHAAGQFEHLGQVDGAIADFQRSR